jgi:hypothetical protein
MKISAGIRKIAAQDIPADEWPRFLSKLKQVRANLCRSRGEWSKRVLES